MQKELRSNIWKYFLVNLTLRRNYIPILSIYFLTLPNSLANQIGVYTGIGWLVGFLIEIPSGHISDKVGHKKAIIFSKFAMLFSTLLFIYGDSLLYFVLGSTLLSVGFAFNSGTSGAFLHNTLVGLKKEKDYAEINGKIRANVSLISAAMILLLPLLTKISIIMPIKAYLIFDVIGIIVAFSLFVPKIKYGAQDKEGEKVWSQIKRFKGTGFYVTSLFLGIITGFVFGLSPFKEPFVESLGFPIVFIGAVMAFSRVVWFIIGHNIKFLKRIKIQKLLFYEIFFFSGLFILSSFMKNPYIVGFLIAIIIGYFHGRRSLIGEYYLKNFLVNKRYKATMFSIKNQIGILFQSGVALIIGIFMARSFSFGFLVSGIIMLVVLLAIYPFMVKGYF